ncbi:MAG: ABC transporter substrate-binding protein [Defluviitaleaceae bacterium]|nr:ABC transporter substrate-binding protein [Defluviitaleaceae bacterium]
MRKKILAGFLAVLMLTASLTTSLFGVTINFNGEELLFDEDSQPFIQEGRTFLPVRAIAETLGFNVDFDEETGTVMITSPGFVPPRAPSSNLPSGGSLEAVLAHFPQTTQNTAPPLQRGDEGNILRVAIGSYSTLSGYLGGGVFGWGSGTDNAIAQIAGTNWSIFSSNQNRAFGNTGIATYTVNTEEMYIHITQNYNVLWHDGTPLTLDDLVFAYETIAHRDYTGIRFTAPVQSVRGVWAYHHGEADYISGLVLSENQRELTIYFDEMPPSLQYFFMWSIPMPRHAFEGIEVRDMEYSDPVHRNPIGWGPFRIAGIILGEAVFFEAFDDFFLGAPMLDMVVAEIVRPDMIPYVMAGGLFDIATNFPLNQIQYYADADNFQFLSQLSGVYSYFAFRLGHYDWETGQSVVDPTRPAADVRLRHAMAYAIDQETMARELWYGMRFPANSVITPFHGGYLDPNLQGFPYDPQRANELLDEAGFAWGDDGYRLNQAGEPMTLILAIHELPGGINHEIAYRVIRDWSNVGVRVELLDGHLHDFNMIVHLATQDGHDDEADLFFGNWVIGANPNPASVWGPEIQMNFSRFQSPAMNQVFDNLASVYAWDDDFRLAQYREIQRLFNYYSPAIINNWRVDPVAVSNRVTGFTTVVSDETTRFGSAASWHLVGVTSPAPWDNWAWATNTVSPPAPAQAIESPLIGTWTWAGDSRFFMSFEGDGTGQRNWENLHIPDDFTWWTLDDWLMKDMVSPLGNWGDDWIFDIYDDVLIISHMDIYGLEFVYLRHDGEIDLPPPREAFNYNYLLGEWRWQDDQEFFIQFNADGTGSRNWGSGGAVETFEWWVFDFLGNLLFIEVVNNAGRIVGGDRWDFTMVDDTLVIENLDFPSIVFTYVRP